MRAYSKYKQGFFHPNRPQKYNGSKPIIYRSGLELEFMKWADRYNGILEWGSESVIIPYIKPTLDPSKTPGIHRYYIDFNFTLKTDKGIQKYIIEVKPFKQTQPPKSKTNGRSILREQFTYAVNNAKWNAVRAWASKTGYKFGILTEKDLPKYK